MGMDVIGNNGMTSFGLSWWQWRPLANYCFEVAPDICNNSDHQGQWSFNDGSMTDSECKALATILQNEINSDRTKEYEKARYLRIDAMTDEQCDLCKGTGTRNDKYTEFKDMVCNKCSGEGTVRPIESMYPFHTHTVQAFTDFLKTCGGFVLR